MSFNFRVSKMAGVVVLSVLSVAAFAASSLDGTKWRVEMTPSGATIPQYFDQVSFQEEKLNTVIFQRKGFTPAPYTIVEKAGGPKVWEVSQKNEAEGDLTWHGELQGDALTGTLLWKKKDGTVVTYALVGAPAVEEVAAPETGTATTAPGTKTTTAPKAKKGFGCSLVR